ncbi:MAG: hypothetical protein U9R02_09935 [Thermodesulfobacteriota bacterium]|nr:hypothetical protein [Thermodesulfobacteriota bacterium]
MPGLRTHLEIDKGLHLVVQTRPDVRASYPIPVRLSACPHRQIIPRLRDALASAGRLPPETPSPLSRCHTVASFASIKTNGVKSTIDPC